MGRRNIRIILIAAFILRLLLHTRGTLQLDVNTFIAWSNNLVNAGFARFYDGWSDYLPGYLYILWILGNLKEILPLPQILIYKLPAITSDIISGYLIYRIVKATSSKSKEKAEKLALISSSLFLFNPAILANSTFWGQVDSLTSTFTLLAIWLANTNPILSSLTLSFGALIKPQAAFASIAILFVMIKNKWGVKKITAYILLSALVFVAAFLPFTSINNLLPFIFERLNVTLNQYPYTSINAFNLWAVIGLWKEDTTITQIIGLVLTLTTITVSAYKLFRNHSKTKQNYSIYLLLAVIFASTYLFPTRVHERHLLPTLAPLSILLAFHPQLIISYLGLSATYVANLAYSYTWITENFYAIFSSSTIKIISVLNIIFISELLILVFKDKKTKSPGSFLYNQVKSFLKLRKGYKKESVLTKKRQKDEERNKEKHAVITSSPLLRAVFPLKRDGISAFDSSPDVTSGVSSNAVIKYLNSNWRTVLLIILSFSFITRVIQLNKPSKEYFDEVYHAFTARRMLHNDPKAWEWWNTPPEGFAYEWTHPPLAKEFMVLGMIILGENPLGWRIPAAITGTAVVFIIFLITKNLFKDNAAALMASTVFALEGLPLVMSRIGMNDMYFLFFVLLSIYLYQKDKNFVSAISLGLAAAAKWTVMWSLPIFAVIHFMMKKKIRLDYFWFFILPPAVYIISYIPMFLTGHDFSVFVGVQKQMWWYHTGLSASHAFSSAWWSWPFLARPVWLFTDTPTEGVIRNIYAMGNPFVFWFGIIAVVSSLKNSYFRVNKSLALVTFSYLIFFVPWAASPRIMFLYHYLPSIPFLSILLAYTLRKTPKLLIPAFIIMGVSFLYFYPHWTGLAIPSILDKSYYWFPSWR